MVKVRLTLSVFPEQVTVTYRVRLPGGPLSYTTYRRRKVTYLPEYRALWARCDARQRRLGAQWYPTALAELVDGLQAPQNASVETVTAVAAHLSPRIDWQRNIEATHVLMAGGERPRFIMTGPWQRALLAHASTTPLETFSKAAVKTSAFARALAGDPTAAVIDTHMIHAGLGYRPSYNGLSTAEYRRLYVGALAALDQLAAEVAAPVTAVQATLWLQWKSEKAGQEVSA